MGRCGYEHLPIKRYYGKEIQNQEVREKFKEFKNENNLMRYVNDLVKAIMIYKDGKIEIRLSFSE